MSLFRSPTQLRKYQGGADSFALAQQTPDSGQVTGRVGTGSASGDTTFTLRPGARHLLPSECYFRVRATLAGQGAGLASAIINRRLTYAENWPATLFATVRIYMNGSLLEESLFPAVSDTCATISGSRQGWLKSFASGSGVGESWSQRIAQLAPRAAVSGADASLDGQATATFEACFRPPLSFFNTCYAILGNEWRIVFSWSPRAETSCVEASSLQLAVAQAGFPAAAAAPPARTVAADGDYTVTIDRFDMFVATVQPAPTTPLPKRILLDLSPIRVIQQSLNSDTNSFNVSVPPSTYRIGFAFQPATTGSTSYLPSSLFQLPPTLTSFRFTSSELGLQAPLPEYTFTGAGGAGATRIGAGSDLKRAYTDFCQASQGQNSCDEGSVEFGEFPLNPLIPQQSRWAYYATPADGAGAAIANNAGWRAVSSSSVQPGDGSAYGWLGRYNMFLFNTFRPAGSRLSTIDVNVNFSAVPAITMYVICWYSTYARIDYEGSQVVGSMVDLNA